MAKVGQVVRDALLLIRTVDAAEAVPAEHMQDGIFALNAMLRRWEANGISLGWNDVSSPEDVAAFPDEAMEAVSASLAVRLAPRFGVQPDPAVVQIANDGLTLLRRDVRIANPLEYKRRGSRYNIYTDRYS